MAIASMTGFARSEGETLGCAWTWELRSVNGRGLELRCRLPSGFEGVEVAARQRLATAFKRGNITASLNLAAARGAASVRVNEEVLAALLAVAARLRRKCPDWTPPSVDGLLALRGVIELEEAVPTAGEARAALEAALLAGLDEAIARLRAARAAEGERLAAVLAGQLDQLAALTEEAGRLAAAQPEAILARLQEQVQALLDAVPALPAERLAQEAALLAVKADPREELDRLTAHVAAARALLAGEGAIGRQLDFLCQELNREANTLCAKAANVDLTRLGLALKVTVDQLREQVQNLE